MPVLEHDVRLERFRLFDRLGGKFRLAVVNACNLDCFFCHNEAMANPRSRRGTHRPQRVRTRLGMDDLLGLVDAWTALGGRQVNLTGGEPLAWKGLFELLDRLEKRDSRIVVNTNALLADRLLARARHAKLDGLLASLHSTSEERFAQDLGSPGASKVMRNIVALRDHGYGMTINYSLGSWNLKEFPRVLAFALHNRIPLKLIALVRPTTDPGFYGGEWVDPHVISSVLDAAGARHVRTERSFGGRKSVYDVDGTRVQVKNIAEGRLRTDFCAGCTREAQCGEGIYGLRVGVDGVFKPCLLRSDAFVRADGRPWREQVLDHVSAMVGDWHNACFATGAPR